MTGAATQAPTAVRWRGLGKYGAILKTQIINSLAYPADLLSRSLTIVLFMWVFLHLWRATYSAVGRPSIAGLTLRDTLWYLMLAEAIVLSKPRLSREIAEAVRSGAIAYQLNKPYNFVLYHLSTGLGDGALRIGFNLLAGGAIVWATVGPPPDPVGWPLVAIAVAAAWLIDFCISTMIGFIAFVTEEITAFEWIYSKMRLLLGGVLIPLDFFPDWLQNAALSLPFAYTVYGPARLFVDPNTERFADLLLAQAAWLGLFGLLLAVLYRKGARWLTINGG